MESDNYGILVKNLRISNGLTQNQVAESLGVTPGYISNVENNRTAMSLRMLIFYARLVGCSLDSLVGELEPEYAETALDRKLYQAILKLDMGTKEKLLKTLDIWAKK
ncbi:MAG: helix-turn-helix transcriptional regulator [Lachnospiraceae bacterium]|nr:helix-turn-helix transcriptional regulator [Lachnospiraceae bacterium]